MRQSILVYFLLLSLSSAGQKTWYGEIGSYAGGGGNDIFRFVELEGSGSFTGRGMWTAGADLRFIITDHFSIETGLGYSHQYYLHVPAPGLPAEPVSGSFGMVALPVTARLDFLSFFFADAGLILALQTGSSDADNMSGLGATAGIGFQYMFKNDIYIRLRAYSNHYALLHFIAEDDPQVLWNSGLTFGVGYRFIHLGKCNCPDDNSPRRRFF